MNPYLPPTGWAQKFRNALRGIAVGFRGQRSFPVHIVATLLVATLAGWLQITAIEWGVLLVCIGLVVTTEYVNSSIEHLARAVTDQEDSHLRNALDIAAGAVLVASLIAVAGGACVFLPYLWATS